ncbi:MAG TPA: hypothetical protein GX497_01640 [Bacillus bacterium]|nr:hypothetical protein [Bacillus sp. (in: firmicutes)]
MYKTITLRVSQEELQKISQLREQHFQKFQAPISQSQLIRNLIHEKFNASESEIREVNLKEKEDLFTEKEMAHKRDLTIVDRLRERRWGRVKG